MPGLKSVRRMRGVGRLRHLKDLRALKGGRDFDDKERRVDPLPEPRMLDTFGEADEETELDVIFRRMGGQAEDAALAQRVLGWKQSEIPYASIPEAIVYDHLKIHGRSFLYQHYVFGGRTARGGVVPDFLVESGGEWIMWNVNGEYWHSEVVNQGKDNAQKYRLLGAIVLGLKIGAIVELWESDLYDSDKRNLIWTFAYAGRGLRN